MWHFTGRYTPQGNIGKYDDETIEDWIGWPHEPGALIGALVDAGWIDRDDEYRLLAHDWDEGCDEATKKAVHRRKNEDGSPKRLIGEMRKNPGGAPDSGLIDIKQTPVDPRFVMAKRMLVKWWAEANGKEVEMAPWGTGTTRALLQCLAAEPMLDAEEIDKRLLHRYQAIEIARQRGRPERGDINETANLYDVIRQLPKFSNGPVNGFGDKL